MAAQEISASALPRRGCRRRRRRRLHRQHRYVRFSVAATVDGTAVFVVVVAAAALVVVVAVATALVVVVSVVTALVIVVVVVVFAECVAVVAARLVALLIVLTHVGNVGVDHRVSVNGFCLELELLVFLTSTTTPVEDGSQPFEETVIGPRDSDGPLGRRAAASRPRIERNTTDIIVQFVVSFTDCFGARPRVRQKFVAFGMFVSGDCFDGALDVGLPVYTG
jgi:hypothetical protein